MAGKDLYLKPRWASLSVEQVIRSFVDQWSNTVWGCFHVQPLSHNCLGIKILPLTLPFSSPFKSVPISARSFCNLWSHLEQLCKTSFFVVFAPNSFIPQISTRVLKEKQSAPCAGHDRITKSAHLCPSLEETHQIKSHLDMPLVAGAF